MKLRIARKMDPKPRHRGQWFTAEDRARFDKRPWQGVYNVERLRRAEVRLHRSWQRACPPRLNAEGKLVRSLTEDFFRGNRVRNRRERVQYIRQIRRRERGGA